MENKQAIEDWKGVSGLKDVHVRQEFKCWMNRDEMKSFAMDKDMLDETWPNWLPLCHYLDGIRHHVFFQDVNPQSKTWGRCKRLIVYCIGDTLDIQDVASQEEVDKYKWVLEGSQLYQKQ